MVFNIVLKLTSENEFSGSLQKRTIFLSLVRPNFVVK